MELTRCYFSNPHEQAISVGYADGTSTIKSSGTCLPFAGFTDTALDKLVLCQKVVCQFSARVVRPCSRLPVTDSCLQSSDNECGVYANSSQGVFDATFNNEDASRVVTDRFKQLGAGSAICLINPSA